MKYLKSYKIFEAYVDEPSFTRFSRIDYLNGQEEVEFQPSKRTMIGPEEFNDVLVKLGFPDKRNCVHFMDEVAFNPNSYALYGDKIYDIKIDDQSKLGWTFFLPINDWFFSSGLHYKIKTNQEIRKLINPKIFEIRPKNNLYTTESPEFIEELANLLINDELIGCGNLSDLMKSRFWGKYPLFAWTNDKVIISKKYIAPKPPKDPKAYKSEPVLTADDFANLGIERSKIGQFYGSEQGQKIKRMKDTAPFDLRREEALKLLKSWSETL